MVRALVVALLCVAGCAREPAAATSHDEPAPRVDASDLIAKLECNRCHDIAGVAAAPIDKHCVTCHEQIHDGTFARGTPADHERWRARITSIRFAPSLANADRLRRTWLRDFLLAPHDVRPGLVAQMPRLAILPGEAQRIAAHLAPDSDERAPVADFVRGAQLFTSLACGRCHRFGGASVDNAELHAAGREQTKPLASWALAPDLRHARARMSIAAMGSWIAKPRGAMPDQHVAPSDANALAWFIATAPLAEPARRALPLRLPVLAREVTWDELETKVFRNVCWHCHAVPELARGDGGPGNSGGFGFAPRGLDLSSYTGISAGSLDDAGQRRSVFAKLPDGTPRIVAHLYARHVEAAGGTIPGIRGMPLGLPALPLEDIQLVETWIAQGRPR